MSQYDEKVCEGRTLAKRSEDDQWRLAELTWKAVEEDGQSRLQWADDVQINRTYASRLYLVWARWSVHARAQRPPFRDAYNLIVEGGDTPDEARERKVDRQAAGGVRKASVTQRAEIARELLSDPEVAEQIADDITEHVAADPVRTAHVISKRREHDPTPAPAVADVRPQRNYDAMVEQWVNLASVTFAAESAGTWKPNEHSEALLYFISQIIGKRSEPTGDKADFVNEKLESLFSEAEAYANSEVS